MKIKCNFQYCLGGGGGSRIYYKYTQGKILKNCLAAILLYVSADIEQTSSIETSSIVSPWLYLATYEEKKLRRLIYEDLWRVTSCGKSKQLSSCSQLIPWEQDGVQNAADYFDNNR